MYSGFLIRYNERCFLYKLFSNNLQKFQQFVILYVPCRLKYYNAGFIFDAQGVLLLPHYYSFNK